MMSRKSWMKTLTALELLPLVAATTVGTSLIAYAQESAPKAPDAQVAAQSSAPSTASAQPAPATGQVAATGQAQAAVPAQAPAAAAAVPAPVAPTKAAPASLIRAEPYDLNINQAGQVVKDLHIDVVHEDTSDPKSPIRNVTLRGKMFIGCAGHISITNTSVDSSVSATNSIGFKITYDGKVDCAEEHKGQACTASTCVSLSAQFEGATMDLTNLSQEGNIQLLHQDPEKDRELQAENIGRDVIKFENAETLRKRVIAEEDEKRTKRNEENREIFKSCQHSLIELAVATKALNALIRDAGVVAAEDIKSMRDELKKAKEDLQKKKVADEFKGLQKRINKLKDLGDVEELSEEISQFADDHPEFAGSARRAQLDLISKVEDSMGNAPESFAARKQIYQNMMGMEGVTAAEAKSYRVKMTGLDIAQQAVAMQSGNFGWNEYSSFMSNYNSTLMKSARADYMSSCSSTKSNAMSDACMQAMNNYRAVQQMPQAAMSAMQQQYNQQLNEQRQQMQMQSQLNQYMSSTMNVGVQGAQGPGFMGASAGFNGNQSFGGNQGFAGMSNMSGMNGMNGMMPSQNRF